MRRDWTTSVEEVMDSLHVLVEQGKVLYLGISDTPAWVVSAMQTYAIRANKTPIAIYQGRWVCPSLSFSSASACISTCTDSSQNVMTRDFEREIIPMARYFGMALAPWDVLGGGKFQSKKAMEARKKAGEGLRAFGPAEQTPEQVEVSEALTKVAVEHSIESVTTIALAYVRAKVPNVFPIIGGRKVEHLHDNIKALSIKLTKEQVEFLESHTKFDVGFPMNFVGNDAGITGQSGPITAGLAKIEYITDNKPFGLA